MIIIDNWANVLEPHPYFGAFRKYKKLIKSKKYTDRLEAISSLIIAKDMSYPSNGFKISKEILDADIYGGLLLHEIKEKNAHA